jgi:HK97 family phage major capsid protein
MSDSQTLSRRAAELHACARDLRSRIDTGEVADGAERALFESQAQVARRVAEITERQAKAAERRSQRQADHIAEHGASLSLAGHGEESDAYLRYMKTGDATELRTALNAGTGANGGFFIPEPLHAPLIEKYRKLDPISTLATHIDMTGNVSVYLPYKSAHGVATTATETGARSEQTEPTMTGGTATALTAYDYYTDQRASQTWVDGEPTSGDMMLNWVYGDLAEQFGVDVAVGNGSNCASGLFAATSFYTTALSGSAGAITNTGLQTLFTTLLPQYWQNAVWIMAPATLGVALAFAMPNLNNTPMITQLANGDLMMMGKKIYIDSSAPAIGAANYPVAFGDVEQGYITGTHHAASILVDPYTAAPNVRYYGLCRQGGRPWNPNAVVLLKSNNS